MTIETTLVSTLEAESTLTALIAFGSPQVHRIYPKVAPVKVEAPYILYHLIATDAHHTFAASGTTERKLFQVDCWSKTYAEAKSIANAVKTALATAGYQTRESDDYHSQVQLYRAIIDFALIG